MRRIYRDEDVVRIARMLYPMGVFGFECSLEKVIQELKDYNDFAIHRVICYSDVTFLLHFLLCLIDLQYVSATFTLMAT